MHVHLKLKINIEIKEKYKKKIGMFFQIIFYVYEFLINLNDIIMQIII